MSDIRMETTLPEGAVPEDNPEEPLCPKCGSPWFWSTEDDGTPVCIGYACMYEDFACQIIADLKAERIDQWLCVPVEPYRVPHVIERAYKTKEDALAFIEHERSPERDKEMRERAEAEQAADYPEGNQHTYNYARFKEREWKLMHRTVTPWTEVPTS